jgi:hypothetical protein
MEEVGTLEENSFFEEEEGFLEVAGSEVYDDGFCYVGFSMKDVGSLDCRLKSRDGIDGSLLLCTREDRMNELE